MLQKAPQKSEAVTKKKWDWMVPAAMLTASLAAFTGSVSYAVFSIKTGPQSATQI
jgi:hypothetical protein